MARRRRNYGSFSADIDRIVITTEKRLVTLMRLSLQDTINIMQEPVAKGGRMRVDTGFLRASGQSSLTGLPTGPIRGDKPEYASPDRYQQADLKLGDLKMGNTFFFGWTAAYAAAREVYDGFMERGLQQWGRIVTINTDKIRERIK